MADGWITLVDDGQAREGYARKAAAIVLPSLRIGAPVADGWITLIDDSQTREGKRARQRRSSFPLYALARP